MVDRERSGAFCHLFGLLSELFVLVATPALLLRYASGTLLAGSASECNSESPFYANGADFKEEQRFSPALVPGASVVAPLRTSS